MRTFAQKPKASQQGTPTKSTIINRARLGSGHDVKSMLHLQRAIGNQAVHRLLQANAEKLESTTTNAVSAGFAHDFSRIQVYPDDIHQIAQNGISGKSATLPYLHQIQRSFGPEYDLGKVKAYVGGQAAEATQRIGAEAYTTGERIAFGPAPSLRTAAHEAAHIVQQRAGVQLHCGLGQAGDRYEQHADQVANEVVAGRSAEGFLDKPVDGAKGPTHTQKQTVQFWGPEHWDFTRRAVDRWNVRHPNGTSMHIAEHLKTWMVKCSDDPDHTGRAYDYLIAGHASDARIYADFLVGGKKRRQKEYAEAAPVKKRELYDAALRSVCPSEGPTHGEGNRPNYGSGGRAVNHAYMMSQIRWADRLTFGGFMSRAGAGQLGDAMHCAQDRGSHWEGDRHEGHDDVRDKLGIDGYDTDDPAKNILGKHMADYYSDIVLAEFAKLRGQR